MSTKHRQELFLNLLLFFLVTLFNFGCRIDSSIEASGGFYTIDNDHIRLSGK